ncbi:MAG: hypothetical protein K2X09_06430 [Rickettsiales bacterium]|nr:hypothetical protein [Rickettsiales bacterium]
MADDENTKAGKGGRIFAHPALIKALANPEGNEKTGGIDRPSDPFHRKA